MIRFNFDYHCTLQLYQETKSSMEVNVSISPSTDSEAQSMEIRLNAMSHIMYKIGKTFNLDFRREPYSVRSCNIVQIRVIKFKLP